MKKINFNQLIALLKNNNFNLFYKNNSKSRSFKDNSKIIISSNSIDYKHGIIDKNNTKDIYIFDNQFIAFKDYINYKMIEIQLISES